jgi:hypothetical protein
VVPAELLLQTLAGSRRSGLRFRDAWLPAVKQAAAGSQEWAGAFAATRSVWEAAYDHVPASRPERALVAVRDDCELASSDGRHSSLCEHCDGPLPAARRSNARYCSTRCKREANYGRERQLVETR